MTMLVRRTLTPERAAANRWLLDFPTPWASAMEDRLPRIEEFLDGNTVVVRFEMPGIDPDSDVEITIADGALRIKAERKEETAADDKHAYHSEFRYGAYSRSIELPAGASDKDVKATYKDGILEVRVPVSVEKAEAKKVPVTRV